jgi:DNA-directed RNA polymerase specialized sigma24 family protein
MEAKSLLKKDWTPTPEAFDKLLGWLSEDREQAGVEYEKIRQKLIKLFKWRNCLPEEDYADITINRVTRRVFEGSEVPQEKPYLYFHGTALNVIREFWRGRQKNKHEDFEDVSPLELATENPQQKIEADLSAAQIENRYGCMTRCLRQLPDDTRQFIIKYHHGERKKDVRKEMAEAENVPLNVLRIRACRIRADLEKCVAGCVAIKNS